jgi:subtilisin family serine protease
MRKILAAILLLVTSFSYSAKAETFSFPTVAIIDTGINSSLEFFKDRIVHEVCLINFDPVYNSCPNGSNVMEGPGSANLPLNIITKNGFDHGTQMSSVAVKTNLTVKIVFIRIIGYNQDGSRQISGESSLNNALDWVYKNKEKFNIQAVSMSQGHHNLGVSGTDYCPKTPITENKINELISIGVPTFFSAGNGRDYQRIDWPSCIPSSIAIGATTPEKSIAIYSNFDPSLVDFFALGTHRAFNPDGKIKNIAGTSASAVVAATQWATVKNNRPSLSYLEVYDIFSRTSILTSNSKVTGGKLINFEGAFYDKR